MKLPYKSNSYIPRNKLKGYLLSVTHPVGKFKAKYFKKIGFDISNASQLEKELLSIAHNNEVSETKNVPYGVNYVINGKIKFQSTKETLIKTVWFIGNSSNKPRFVTAIPGIIRSKNGRKRYG